MEGGRAVSGKIAGDNPTAAPGPTAARRKGPGSTVAPSVTVMQNSTNGRSEIGLENPLEL